MKLVYDQGGDSVAVLMRGEIGPDDTAGTVIEYQFFNAKRDGVRLDDLEHRVTLGHLLAEAGIAERTWSRPVRVTVTRRRRQTAAG